MGQFLASLGPGTELWDGSWGSGSGAWQKGRDQLIEYLMFCPVVIFASTSIPSHLSLNLGLRRSIGSPEPA